MKKIPKPWGQEIIIENNKVYSLKKINYEPKLKM